MGRGHIAADLLERFLRLDASRREGRDIVHHLLSGCPECSAEARRIASGLGLFGGAEHPSPEAYEQAFTRALAAVSKTEERFAREKLHGWAQWASVEPSSPADRLAIVMADPAYHTVGFHERLLDASRWYIRTDPREAVDVIALAIAVAERLDPEVHGRERLGDLRARVFADLGNARRLASDFEGSRQAFNEAWRILEDEGTGDPWERAHLIVLESGYIQDMGEFETAETSLEAALAIYRSLGDRHLEGRTLLKMADCIGQALPKRGIAYIKRALPLIEAAKEPRLELCAQHDLAWFLHDLGHPEEALIVLDHARPLYRQFPDRWTQLRLHWLEGRIAASLGDLAEAESIFKQLWEELRARNLNHELVLVSIDLAEILVRKGDLNRAADLAAGCLPIMTAWGLHRYAVAAWVLFQEALAQGQISIFSQIRTYYLRHWSRPVVFSPDGG